MDNELHKLSGLQKSKNMGFFELAHEKTLSYIIVHVVITFCI